MSSQHKGGAPVYIHPAWQGTIVPPTSPFHPAVFFPYTLSDLERRPPATAQVQIKAPAINGAFHSSPDSFSGRSTQTLLETPPPSTPSLRASEIFYTRSDDGKNTAQTTPRSAGSCSKAGVDGQATREAGLDKYASAYQPLWLRNLPPPVNTIRLPPGFPFPPDHYAAGSLVFPHIRDHLPTIAPASSLLAQPPYSGPTPRLDSSRLESDPHHYAHHFTSLLSLLLRAQAEDMERAMMHQTPLFAQAAPGSAGPGHSAQTYVIRIPGIREDSPRLVIGDRLVLRGLYPAWKDASQLALEAEVAGQVKASGSVHIKAPDLASYNQSLPLVPSKMIGGAMTVAAMYQVQFKVSASPVCAMQDALRIFELALAASNRHGRAIAQRWLFPSTADVVAKKIVPLVLSPSATSLGDALNAEQENAIRAIAAEIDPRVPFLLSGPPGVSSFIAGNTMRPADLNRLVRVLGLGFSLVQLTVQGKTKTLVEAALRILVVHQSAAILLCAPSQSAADLLVLRLGQILKPSEMFRLNSPGRTFAEVPDPVLRFCHIEDDRFGLPPFEMLFRYKVVVCTCLDAAILVNARASNAETMRAELGLHAVLHPFASGASHQILPHWTHLLIDEAGQASEPETLIPMSVLLPIGLPDHFTSSEPMIVLCGDIHQLGPVISSLEAREGDLDMSLLERLFERDVYASHPKARSNLKAVKLLEQTVANLYRPPFANLLKNYRSIGPILMLPAALFYDDTLQAAARDVSLIHWSGLPNKDIPVVFHGSESSEDWIEEGASWYNEGEIIVIVEQVRSLLSECTNIRQQEIAVITPWREQVWRTRSRLRKVGLGGVDVGNVETYQGREFKATIVSCVRSRERFLPHDRRTNMGLINERKRFNVAISRTKELLIVVGNANVLKTDPYWNGFLQVMVRNNLYIGPTLEMEMTGAYMSKLESSMRFETDLSSEAAGLTLAGDVAREALR